MILRSVMFSLALCAIVVARVVCPCVSMQATGEAPAASAAQADHHSCCGKLAESRDEPKAPAPTPCDKHGENCTHCGTQLAPSDKAVDASQFSVSPAMISTILEPVTGPKRTLVRTEPRLIDPSPPSLLSLHCSLVI